MRVAIVGYGIEGFSSYKYFKDQGHELTIIDEDSNLEIPDDAQTSLGEHAFDNLSDFDLIVRSAGILPDRLLLKNPGLETKLTTQLNEFLKTCPSHNIVGVTGTKGKGTTTTLIAKMLEASGKQTVAGGNIGVPMLDLLEQINEDTFVVLELSSFQLTDLSEAAPHIGVCLMVAPEHLNWHKDLDDYLNAKSQLFSHQSANDVAIYLSNNELSSRIASVSPGSKIPYFSAPGAFVDNNEIIIDDNVICKTDEIELLGKHNWQNVCAAITAVWQISKDTEAMRSVLTSFSGLEHRLELVGEFGGVRYYDDSFGTTPETAVVAIEAFDVPKIVIAGGSDKGVDYTPMIEAIINNNVKQTVCIGFTGRKIATMLKQADPNAKVISFAENSMPTMSEIVRLCRDAATPGDVVLLSTGSASFGMFKNYKDRGEQFKAAVLGL